MELLLLFFFVSIVFSFLCSIWEAVLLSIPPSYVAAGARVGTRTGQILSHFKEDIDRPLAAILTLNTIAHTVGAIGVGAQASKLLSDTTILGLNVAAFVVPAVMTLAILILSEIIPKTLGAGYWRELSRFTASSLQLLIYLLYPLVMMSRLITRMLKKDGQGSVLSRSEFSAMAEVIAEQGVLQKHEYRILKNLLRFEAVRARDVMTPRTVVVATDENQTIAEFHEANPSLRLSRIPVFETSIDHVTGFVIRNDILSHLVGGQGHVTLQAIRRPILVVREDDVLPEVFNTLLEKRAHIAIVVGEYGGTSGVLTMEDVVETLLGLEIVDEFDRTADMQQVARKNWEQRARKLGLIEEDPPTESRA
ncbi:MAG: HlyC/CorC family transporter [Desulfosarcina sp.]|nr:HlyC/CorC family transporter [Desulfobacterales bacterium]